MEYFSLKRIIRNWDKKQSVFIYGRTLSAVHFSTEQPYTLKNFVNYKDGETGQFCVEVKADRHSTLASLIKATMAYLNKCKSIWND